MHVLSICRAFSQLFAIEYSVVGPITVDSMLVPGSEFIKEVVRAEEMSYFQLYASGSSSTLKA